MVHLYGVVHGKHQTDLITGETTSTNIKPSYEFLHELAQYPRGTEVGIELLNQEDQIKAEDHLTKITMGQAYYAGGSYYQPIIALCKEKGHKIVFLEDLDVWLRHNIAMKYLRDQHLKFDDLCHEEGETKLDYFIKKCELNDEIYKANIQGRRIHEIDRDNVLLNNIRNNMEVVIAGVVHTDFWIPNSQFIRENYGIIFDSYSTDTNISGTSDLFFTKNAIPKPELVYSRKSLERAINLIKNGKITNNIPNYVGTWRVNEPSKGYFELFVINEENGVIRGTIEDCLGSATFEGVQKNGEFNFTKRYTQHDIDAIRANIVYKSKRNGKGFTGYYHIEGDWFNTAFYIIQSSQEKPLNLARYWAETNLKEEVVTEIQNSDELPF